MASFRMRSGKWPARIQRKGFPNQFKPFINKADAVERTQAIETGLDRGIFIARRSRKHYS